MNTINPKVLLHSKWTKVDIQKKEKHFIVVSLTFDENQSVIECIMEAVISKNQYDINWRDLKNSVHWKVGWQ